MYSKAEKKARTKLLEMLKYRRPEGGVTQQVFNDRFIRPMMGKPDEHGNYIKIITHDNPEQTIRHCFMAHHDTVHSTEGIQKLEIWYDQDGTEWVGTANSNCLGADCTTGAWLVLEMIKAKIPGIYVIHAGEEVGGIGSSSLMQDYPQWIDGLEFAIAFDRKAENSVITYQTGGRCCSEEFVLDLESILNLNLKSDSGGTYTDSAEYTEFVSECTNLSVGYYRQHTKEESQNITFALKLRDRLIKADWEKLNSYRDPSVQDFGNNFRWNQKDWDDYYSKFDQGTTIVGSNSSSVIDDDDDLYNPTRYNNMYNLVKDYPRFIAEYLEDLGVDPKEMMDEVKLFYNNKIQF